MLTKGIIQSINNQSNTCLVRVPIFETAGNEYKNEAEAIFTIQPGIFNGYKVGDVVIVGFDCGNEGAPIILGKLYLGQQEESTAENSGAVCCSNLEVTSKAVIPADTKITFDSAQLATADVQLSAVSSLYDIIKAIKNNNANINTINTTLASDITYSYNEQAIGTWINNKQIFKRTICIPLSYFALEESTYTLLDLPANTVDEVVNITQILAIDGVWRKQSEKIDIRIALGGTAYGNYVTVLISKNEAASVTAAYITIEYTKK